MAFGEAACTEYMFNLSNKNSIAILMIKDRCLLYMGLEEAYLGPYQIYSTGFFEKIVNPVVPCDPLCGP